MSDTLINSLNGRVSELTSEKANLQAALREARRERKEAVDQLAGLRQQVAELTTDRDSWKGKAEAAPGEQARRVTELEGQLRQRDHRDAFRAAAVAAGVKTEAVDDLYSLSGLKPPEGDATQPDQQFAEFLTAAKSSRSWAFGGDPQTKPVTGGSSGGAVPGDGATPTLRLGATAPPAGAGRGASAPPASPVPFTNADINEPGWQVKRPDLVKAIQGGYAQRVD